MIRIYKNLRDKKDLPDISDRLMAGESGLNKLQSPETLIGETRDQVEDTLRPLNFEAIKSRTLEYLQKEGYLNFSKEHNKWLADTEKLKQLDFRQLDESGLFANEGGKKALVKLAKSISPKDQTRYCAIFAILADISASPLSDPDSEAKPLLFRPTPENIYEPDTYKHPNSLLSITDLSDSKRPLQINNFRYPEFSLDDSKRSWILYYIYHPGYGAGERNEAGELIVNCRDKIGHITKRAKITQEWLMKHHLQLNFGEDELANMPALTLEKHGKSLAERDGLRPDDFRRIKTVDEAFNITRTITQKKGTLSFNGAGYDLGAAFFGGSVTHLAENLALIKKRNNEWYIFEPLTTGEVSAVKTETSSKKRFSWQSEVFSIAKHLHQINPAKLPAHANDSEIIQFISHLTESSKNPAQKLEKLFDVTYVPPDTTKISSKEKIEGFADFLKKHKAVRLRLESPEEKISDEQMKNRRDDEYGFLCVYDEKQQCYRKISTDFIRHNFAQFQTNLYQQLYDNPEVDLRPSDLGVPDFVPRRLNGKGRTPTINSVGYTFPTTEFQVGATGERIKINPETDRFLKLSDEYAALIVNRPNGTRAYQLKLGSKKEMEQDPVHQARFKQYKLSILSAGATIERLTEWDITPFIPPRSNESPQEYARRIARCGDINRFLGIYRELIDGAQFNLQNYDLKKQLLFANYYANLKPDLKQELQELLREHGESFFNAFQACEFGLGMGDTVVKIAKTHGEAAMPIFSQFEELMSILGKKEELQKRAGASPGSFDETKYYTVVVKRGADLLKAVAGKKAGEDLSQFVKEAGQYRADVVAFGAQLAAVATTTKTVPTSPEVINEALSDVRVDELKAGDIVKKGSRLAMQSSKNYLHPERFNEKDYKMIVENLEQAYGDIDPGWLQHLIDNIPNDLNNPKVTFLLVKNKEGDLVGVIKRKKEADDKYYFGTMYVEPEYQKGFGIGQYLDSYMKQGLPENAVMEGTVAAANTAAARHIDAVGYVGNRITTEGEGKKKSQPLINLDLNPRYPFETKNRKAFSEEKIKEYHAQNKALNGVRILLKDTSDKNVEAYTKELDEFFSQGYCLTRFFYADGRSQEQTYLVLEKPLSGRQKVMPDEALKEAA